jgi:ELMO/CED-12 family
VYLCVPPPSSSSSFFYYYQNRAATELSIKPYQKIFDGIGSGELNIRTHSVAVVNAMLKYAPDPATYDEVLLLLNHYEFYRLVSSNFSSVETDELTRELYAFQKNRGDVQFREKDIMYDKQNEQHEAMLMDLWKTMFPDKELDARVSEEWKKLGFQGTDPATDFRGMGIVGLKHILYIGKVYTDNYRQMASEQQSRKDHYYPTSVAGIYISQMLFELLEFGKPGMM